MALNCTDPFSEEALCKAAGASIPGKEELRSGSEVAFLTDTAKKSTTLSLRDCGISAAFFPINIENECFATESGFEPAS